MTDLCSKLVRIVEREWPVSVDDLEMKDIPFQDFAKHNHTNMGRGGWPVNFVPEPAAAIALAQEFNIESILPSAYYDLTRCTVSRSWDACVAEEGNSFVETCIFQGKAARWQYLSATDLLKMLRIRELLNGERIKRFKSYFNLTGECTHPGHSQGICREETDRLMSEAHLESTACSDSYPDVLKVLRHLRMKVRLDEELCNYCRNRFSEEIFKRRNEIWRQIEKMSR